ncbi:MAG: elongation factor P [bacterium]|jgi:elongation factor P|nr:elongation factor P [Phycisphaeraceae bacterium]
MKAIDLRPGFGIKMDGKFCVVTGYEFRNPGNLRSFVNLKFKDVQRGGVVERRFNPADEVEMIDLDRRPMEFLYKEGEDAVFMDSENYDQVTVGKNTLGESLLYLRPNATATLLLHEGRPLLVELPGSVELAVTETEPGVKNATATNVMKEATMETGLKTRVPGFINVGEVLRISTESGSYLSRAKE